MATRPKRAAATTLDEARAELRACRWTSAKERFERLAATEPSPEVFEGLSWSAWWLDEPDEVFDARGRAYRLYRQRGDAVGAARMATWLASDQLDFRGAVAVANGWLRRAHRLLDSLPPGPERGWLAFFEGYIAAAAGDQVRAAEHARRAADLGRQFDVPDLEMLGLGLEGSILVAHGQVDDGMRCLDEATTTALAEPAAIPIAGAWACCFLVASCVAVRDYGRAVEWCDRIAEFADRYGSRYMLAFCRAEYGAVHLWRGRWTDAESVLAASVEDFLRSRPAMVSAPLVGLAELRRRQGRWEEAVRLLEQAGPSTPARVCRARLASDRAELPRAIGLAERLLRQTPSHHVLDRIPALEVLVRAQTAMGELDGAATTLEALREAARLVGTAPLTASAELAEGRIAAARGDHIRAWPLLEDAVDRFERSGAPFETADARLGLATTLVALGRIDAAEREAVAALDQFRALGAEASAAMTRRLLKGSIYRSGRHVWSDLTPREREVLDLLCEGLTNRGIAERLVVSEHTVHRHVTNILRKLDLPSRTAAAAYAIRHGLRAAPGQRPI